ncbi:MAG: polysaccharide biosynthesis C-terminal domain-containing protein [Candidatus Micrarchaeia archaeon]
MISRISRLYEKEKGGFLFLGLVANACAIASMGISYLFNILMARSLSLSDFGLLGVAIAYFTILTIPGGSLSTILTREFSKLKKAGKEREIAFLSIEYAKKALLYSGLVTLLVIAWALLTSRPEVVLMVLMVPLSYAITPLNSVLQSSERIVALSILGLLGSILKLGLGFLAVVLGLGLLGVAGVIPASALVICIITFLLLREFLSRKSKHDLSLRKALSLTTAILVIQGLFLYADLFAVQNFLGNAQTGLYNVAETTAKITYFLSGAVVLVLLPKMAKLDFSRNKKEIALLLLGGAGFLLPPALALIGFPSEIVLFFYGGKFAPAIPAFQALAVGFLLYAIFNVVQYALLAKGKERDVLAINAVGLVLHVLLLAYFVPLQGLVGAGIAVIISSTALLLASLIALLGYTRVKTGK